MAWLYCRHYTGLCPGAYKTLRLCRAGVPYELVGARTKHGRHWQTDYPCCREWGGPDNCEHREWEDAPKLWHDGMRDSGVRRKMEAEQC